MLYIGPDFGLIFGQTNLLFVHESWRKFIPEKAEEKMRTYYRISSDETGMVLLRKRKIAKALRRWLRENGHNYEYTYFSA